MNEIELLQAQAELIRQQNNFIQILNAAFENGNTIQQTGDRVEKEIQPLKFQEYALVYMKKKKN